MAFAEASDGARIFWRAEGDGPPLILNAMTFGTHRHWTHVQRALAGRFRAVTWDYRGHGLSEAPADPARYSLAQVVEDLAAVHEAAAAAAPALVGGLSVGGLVALSYALVHPERVRALMLFNTGPGYKRPEAAARWGAMLERAAEKLGEVGLEAYLQGKRATAELLGQDPDSGAAREALEGIRASSIQGLQLFARHVAGPVPNLVDRLGEIDVPTLVLVGERDEAFLRASEVMTAKLPRARRAVLEGAGHVLHADRPEAFLREVEAFTAGL